jgi:hypothetical protein
MYMPVSYVPAASAGLGDFRRINAGLQESEFYPPPYDSLNPVADCASRGMGDWTDSLTADSVITGLPNWVLLGAGALAFVFFSSRSGKGSARKRARAKYESELDRIDKEFTVSGKARRAARRIPRIKVVRG